MAISFHDLIVVSEKSCLVCRLAMASDTTITMSLSCHRFAEEASQQNESELQ